jgi:predicted ABC-type sugar transport system permease subunit
VVGAIVLAVLWLGLCLSGVRALWRRGGGAVHG